MNFITIVCLLTYTIDFTDLQIGDLKSILIILTILKTAMGQVRQLSDTVLPNLGLAPGLRLPNLSDHCQQFF